MLLAINFRMGQNERAKKKKYPKFIKFLTIWGNNHHIINKYQSNHIHEHRYIIHKNTYNMTMVINKKYLCVHDLPEF